MINVDEVNSPPNTNIGKNNLRLRNLENKFEDLSLRMHDMQATLKLIMGKLVVQHKSPPLRPASQPLHQPNGESNVKLEAAKIFEEKVSREPIKSWK